MEVCQELHITATQTKLHSAYFNMSNISTLVKWYTYTLFQAKSRFIIPIKSKLYDKFAYEQYCIIY